MKTTAEWRRMTRDIESLKVGAYDRIAEALRDGRPRLALGIVEDTQDAIVALFNERTGQSGHPSPSSS